MATDITKYPLSGLEMEQLNPDAKILNYTQLYDYNNVKQLFGKYKKLIILYLIQNERSGHWTCLFKNKSGIHFFDSYGVPVDYELEALTTAQRQHLHEEQDYLKQLLANENVTFNHITYQKPHTATCGCFVTHRLHNYLKDDNKYLNFFLDNKLDPDKYVAEYCFKKLNYI